MSLLKKYDLLSVKNKVEKFIYPVNKYILVLNGNLLRANSDLIIYQDIGFNRLTENKIKKHSLFRVEKIVFSKKGTPRLKVQGGYVTAHEQHVTLTDEPIPKTKVWVEGKEQVVRDDIENYLYDLKDQSVKARSDLKVYEDTGFKNLTEHRINKGWVFKPLAIEVSKGGTPRFKVAKGYVTSNKKYVELTDEALSQTKIWVEGKEQVVRDDIENYLYDLKDQSVKARSDLKVYEDTGFKNLTEHRINEGWVFKPLAIEVSKGGTPRFKVAKGYVTTNKKYVELTDEALSQTKVCVEGKEQVVRDDIENYLYDLKDQSVKARSDLKVYEDTGFKNLTEHRINKDWVFKPLAIEVSKGGTPRFKVAKGYVTTNKKFVQLTNELITELLVDDYQKTSLDDKSVKYINPLNGQLVKALSRLKIYKDINFKESSKHEIAQGDIFKVNEIKFSDDGIARLVVNNGYVTANTEDVELTEDTPLVSLVVPFYNVEKYLEQCLISIKNQSYKNIEVIMVNDGSPDNSYLIAEKFVASDSRFILHNKENGGLSAARNTGIDLARGQYIWFIDSDDIIQENAVDKMIHNLLSNGADFAVGCYRRINSSGVKKAGHWVLDAHVENKNGIKLKDFPDILVNATAWSKVVSSNYIKTHDLYFPVGVLYEDQQWSAKLYSQATAFNIVKDVIYDWRVRDDNSSISQQSKNVDNLDAILTAVEKSLTEFTSQGLIEVANERVVQFLSNNMREYISYLDHTERSYMERLSTGLISLTKNLTLEHWRRVPAHVAAVEWLLINGHYDQVLKSIELGVRNTNTMVASIEEGELILKVPYWNDELINFPKEVIALKESQYKPNIQLRKASWLDHHKLYLEGWAYLPLIDPVQVEKPVKMYLVNESTKESTEIVLEGFLHTQLDRVSSHLINDYKKFGYKTIIDFKKLNLESGKYSIKLEFKAGNFVRSDYLKKVATWGGAGNLLPKNIGDNKCVTLDRKKDKVLLCIENKLVFLEKVKIEDSYTILNIFSEQKISEIEFKCLSSSKNIIKKVSYEYTESLGNIYVFKIPNQEFDSVENGSWYVRAKTLENKFLVIDSNNILEKPIIPNDNLSNDKLCIYSTAYGNLGLKAAKTSFFIKSIEERKSYITISGEIIGSVEKIFSAKLTDHRYSIDCIIKNRENGIFEIRIPFYFNNWSARTLLASGKYELNLYSDSGLISSGFSEDVISSFPLWLSDNSKILGNVEINSRNKNLVFCVHPANNLSDLGARVKQLGIKNHIESEESLDINSVFFRSYYGESATCCSLEIHKELYRRNPNLKLYWSVKDNSIIVPKGGIPVIEGTQAWYKLYSTAKYIIDNTHQPIFFEKKVGQIVVATFHGYPFKKCGLPFWNSHGFSEIQIRSYLRRHDQWDYLLSPAPYATPLLETVFPSNTAKTLEIGYPRNDIFFSKEKESIRAKTRQLLNIPNGKKVILYAPTFRDNLAVNDFKAEMVSFLDFENLLNHLGDDFVLLVRGHAFNARTNERSSILREDIIDVTDYPNINDLCLASDIGVLDYSSLRFDYTLTGNPMIFFVPDLEQYVNDIRGGLVSYEETAPGPLVKKFDDLVYWIKNSDTLNSNFKEEREKFIRNYMPLEDGEASRRFVETVFIDLL